MICSKCKVDLPLDQFKVNKSRGRLYQVKQCTNCVNAQRRQNRIDDVDRIRARENKYIEIHKDRINENSRNRILAIKENLTPIELRAYLDNNNKYLSEYLEKNPDKREARNKRSNETQRRTRKKARLAKIVIDLEKDLRECRRCKQEKLWKDFIVPNGGSNQLCRVCRNERDRIRGIAYRANLYKDPVVKAALLKKKRERYKTIDKTNWISVTYEYKKASRERNKENIKKNALEWNKKNPEKLIEYRKKSMEDLSDHYVTSALMREGWSREDLTPSLIEYKREHLKLYRMIKTSPNTGQ